VELMKRENLGLVNETTNRSHELDGALKRVRISERMLREEQLVNSERENVIGQINSLLGDEKSKNRRLSEQIVRLTNDIKTITSENQHIHQNYSTIFTGYYFDDI